jgi:hypothetical protein
VNVAGYTQITPACNRFIVAEATAMARTSEFAGPCHRAATVVLLAASIAACQSAGSEFAARQGANANHLLVASGPLQPFKETKFSYRPPVEVRDAGDYAVIPYDETKDINERDEIPIRRVRSGYTQKLPRAAAHDIVYRSGPRQLEALAAGKLEGNRPFTVIYLHGREGNREWGFDDERFGGNFNRLKYLIVAAGGLYVSPDFRDFEEKGREDIASLVNRFALTSR